MLCNVVLVSAIQQCESAICIHMPPRHLLDLPPTAHPFPPFQVVIDYQTELPVLNSSFPLAIYFTYGNIYVSMLLSQFIPLSPFFSVSKIYSLCLCLYSCPAKRFISIIFFFRFHIYALMYDIYFSLPELLHSVYNRF